MIDSTESVVAINWGEKLVYVSLLETKGGEINHGPQESYENDQENFVGATSISLERLGFEFVDPVGILILLRLSLLLGSIEVSIFHRHHFVSSIVHDLVEVIVICFELASKHTLICIFSN